MGMHWAVGYILICRKINILGLAIWVPIPLRKSLFPYGKFPLIENLWSIKTSFQKYYLRIYFVGNFTAEEIGEKIFDVVLEPGDLLYFPRGFIHQAQAVEDAHSLHITISTYQRHTWGDVMENVSVLCLYYLMGWFFLFFLFSKKFSCISRNVWHFLILHIFPVGAISIETCHLREHRIAQRATVKLSQYHGYAECKKSRKVHLFWFNFILIEKVIVWFDIEMNQLIFFPNIELWNEEGDFDENFRIVCIVSRLYGRGWWSW